MPLKAVFREKMTDLWAGWRRLRGAIRMRWNLYFLRSKVRCRQAAWAAVPELLWCISYDRTRQCSAEAGNACMKNVIPHVVLSKGHFWARKVSACQNDEAPAFSRKKCAFQKPRFCAGLPVKYTFPTWKFVTERNSSQLFHEKLQNVREKRKKANKTG